MQLPIATYRLQLHADFSFESVRRVLGYLQELGISDIYASPILKARSGSQHGYDVVDPSQLNPELGTTEEAAALLEDLQSSKLGWIQDIVPNHMAYDSENLFLMDVLKNGLDSEYFEYFDISWDHPDEDLRGRILAPMLGDFYGNCLERGEIQIAYSKEGFTVNYYSLSIPLNVESYARLLTYELERLRQQLGSSHPDLIKFLGVLYMLKNIPLEASGKEREQQTQFVESLLWELYTTNSKIQEFLNRNIEIFNGEIGQPESFDLLDRLLDEQFFRLAFWKVGAEDLNYRRFFTVNELICLRIENPSVFYQTHSLIDQLIQSGWITGLRIDHIDGLYDPVNYLRRLQQWVGDRYIVVEKILEQSEELPQNWPVQGTSGYDALIYINSLFCQIEHGERFTNLYRHFTGLMVSYDQLVTEKKRLIADKNLSGDLNNLTYLLKRIASQYRYGRDFTHNGLRKAITEVLISFPIYRTYMNQEGISHVDRQCISQVIDRARASLPQLVNEINLIEHLLFLEDDVSLTDAEKEQRLNFVMRLQQFSGPLMAKGIEDTLFYCYNRFISLNEVGGNPGEFGISVEAFHRFNQQRLATWPQAMTATATHDTKRGEDVRARLNILSELPDDWEAQVYHWSGLNREHKTWFEGRPIPDANDEYFFYQTLIGALPFPDEEGVLLSPEVHADFLERITAYVIKAVREAKVYTAWLRPDTRYEEGFIHFVQQALLPSAENTFLKDFLAWQPKIAFYGIINSLAQTLLKVTIPGMPDIYQGTELWDFSLVDPDNRRPVDFEQRLSFLQEIKRRVRTNTLGLLEDLMATLEDGRIKLFLLTQALAVRWQYLNVFQHGNYLPLQVTGDRAQHVVAFARQQDETTVITVVPRFVTGLVQPPEMPLGEAVWGNTQLHVPGDDGQTWQDAITGGVLRSHGPEGFLGLGQMLAHFPVALLVNEVRTESS